MTIDEKQDAIIKEILRICEIQKDQITAIMNSMELFQINFNNSAGNLYNFLKSSHSIVIECEENIKNLFYA